MVNVPGSRESLRQLNCVSEWWTAVRCEGELFAAVLTSGWPRGTGQLHGPDRALLVQLAFHFEERGDLSVHDPHFDIRGLLADDGSDHAGDTADFDVNVVAPGSMTNSTDVEGIIAVGLDRKMDDARLGAGDVGDLHFGRIGREVFERVGNHSVNEVRRE